MSPRSLTRPALALLAALAACSKSSAPPSDGRLLHVPSPDWRDQIIYMVMTDRFANGDPTNDDQHGGEFDPTNKDKYSGGDLRGVIDHLDYIKGLGATAVWITPPVANEWWDPLQQSAGFHGYWARDFKHVDEHLGTLETYKDLSDALHKRGMYLVQDIVTNHTGNFFTYAPYDPNDVTKGFVKNAAATPTPRPTQPPFDQDDVTDPAQKAAAIYHWTPTITDYTDKNQQFNYQVSDLDDLNTENPVVRKALRDAYGYWIKEVGVDAYRVDTVKYVPHEFWNDFFNSTDPDAPGILAVARATGRNAFHAFGEVFDTSPANSDVAEQEIGTFLGTPDKPELPAALAFPLYEEIGRVFAQGQPTTNMTYRIGRFMDPKNFGNAYVTPIFFDNHDVRRFLAIGTRDAFRQALAFLFTMPGIPVVYYGTEQVFTDTRAAMFKGGYLADKDHFDDKYYYYLKVQKLAGLRAANKVFSRGDIAIAYDSAAAGPFAYKRTLAGDVALVVFNTSDQNVLVSNLDTGLPPGTVLNVVHDEQTPDAPRVDAHGKVTEVLPPRAVIVALATSKSETPATPGATIAVTTGVDGMTLTQDTPMSGTVTPATTALALVVDGLVDGATVITPAADGSWTATLPVSSFAEGTSTHDVSVYAKSANVATPRQKFTASVVFNGPTLHVDDPVGDDKGPKGTYVYPMDTTFHHEQDITGVTAQVGPTTLTLKVTMKDWSTVWNPPLGFDHVSFNVFFQLPGSTTGATVMPRLSATVPLGFVWDFQHFVYGWTNALYKSDGAAATTNGAAVSAQPVVKTNAADKTVIFQYDKGAFSLSSWTGVKVYIADWDFDGIGADYRPLSMAGGQWAYGGGAPTDPHVMDDVAVFTLPAK